MRNRQKADGIEGEETQQEQGQLGGQSEKEMKWLDGKRWLVLRLNMVHMVQLRLSMFQS